MWFKVLLWGLSGGVDVPYPLLEYWTDSRTDAEQLKLILQDAYGICSIVGDESFSWCPYLVEIEEYESLRESVGGSEV